MKKIKAEIKTKASQRGASMLVVLLVGVVVVLGLVIGGQATPILLEHQSVAKAVRRALNEGDTPNEIRAAFDRSAAVDDIRSISGADLEINKLPDGLQIQYAYERDIALVGPAHLVFRFQGTER